MVRLLQEVEHLMQLPAQIQSMVQAGVPWWQIVYTGLMSTDAVLMIEVGLSARAPCHMLPEDNRLRWSDRGDCAALHEVYTLHGLMRSQDSESSPVQGHMRQLLNTLVDLAWLSGSVLVYDAARQVEVSMAHDST